jgi:outer membrane protein, heavy metal efflux system
MTMLAGCEIYEPLPLDTAPRLVADPSALIHVGGDGRNADVDPSGPLDADAFVVLAVENNPDLRAGRADHAVAQAQLLQAGLLPNPQIGGNYGSLLSGPGTIDSWGASFGQDIKGLITLSAQRSAAEQEVRKVDADLLWQEWQVIGKARLLYIDTVEQDKLHELQLEARSLVAARAEHSRHALAAGDLDLTVAAPDFTALTDLDKQIADLDRQRLSRQHDVDALLGLTPDVQLRFVDRVALQPMDEAAVSQAVAELDRRRPDLVALQLGYGAQEEKLRGAILAQFPALSFGGAYGSDTSHIQTLGPQITLELPIFNRNQGNIAIERATRRKLHAEYANRLEAARGEVAAMQRERALLAEQTAQLETALAEAIRIADQAGAAFKSGGIDERSYVELQMTRLGRLQELVALEQQALELRAATATLIGAGLPAITLPAPGHAADAE